MQEAIAGRFGDPQRASRPTNAPSVARRRPLATPRAAVGAFLVVASALAALALARPHHAPPPPAYLVAARDLAPGALIRPSDLTVSRANLPSDLAARAFTTNAAVVGKILVAPLQRGELVQVSVIRPAASAPEGHELALALPSDRVIGGSLAPGDRVSVLATNDDCTVVVAPVATVLDISRPSTSITGGSPIVRLSVPTSDQVVALVQALRTGQVTLTRGSSPITSPTECASSAPS